MINGKNLTDDQLEELFIGDKKIVKGEKKSDEPAVAPTEGELRTYWMPFDSNNGLHDAPWEPTVPAVNQGSKEDEFISPEGFTPAQLQQFFEQYYNEATPTHVASPLGR